MTLAKQSNLGHNENKKESDSQKQRVLQFLLGGSKLTALDALKHFDCMKLSNRISELKKEGWDIRKETIVTKSGKRIAQYQIPI